jgi:DNA (cytosine-5)-methyltransferase 1
LTNGNPIYKDNRDYLIQSEKFKVPQRYRVILLGIREDVDVLPATLTVGVKETDLKSIVVISKLRSD